MVEIVLPKNRWGMRLRDFHSFNLGIWLNKFGDLLLISLCVTVLRAKYDPQGDIFKVGSKAGSSFTWQSIVAGTTTLKRGYIWMVGTGEDINIPTDIFPREQGVLPRYRSRLIQPQASGILNCSNIFSSTLMSITF
jgi:hypothetical protein